MTSPLPPPPVPSSMSPSARFRAAHQRRGETDYFFTQPGMNVFLTVITCGIFGIYLFYQLMRRDRDHNARRLELLEAANALAWEQANERGVADELRPLFERTAAQLEVLRGLTREFRDPVVWLIIDLVAGGIATIIGFIFIDQDLETHDRAECSIEADLSAIYGRLGTTVAGADPARVKGRHNYVGRVIATLATCGIYQLFWLYDMQAEGNAHLQGNWAWEDAYVGAVAGVA